MKASFCCLAVLVALSLSSTAQQPFEFFPGAKYDPAIPTLKQTVGHEWGERITSHGEVERYLEALRNAAPKRVKVQKYAETWEGRALYNVFIGSPETIAKLEATRVAIQKLADPRTLNQNEANALIGSLPSIVWLLHGVHGNEISSTDASLLTMYHLLAARGDEIADAVAKHTLVIFDPMQNPDGRDRFVNFFRQSVGRWADADLQSSEHNEPWPSGRVNHYLFDMNRDWFAQSQPETRGRVKTYLEWFPQVVADLHEMGTQSSYYFAPPALPWNPNLTKPQLEWLTKFGRNNAKWFDQFRFDYFTREGYDSFYPGYGEGWPMFQGAIGMTYEQASVRGLLARRDDETTLAYRDSVHHHFVAALSTVENAAKNRAELLRYFYEYRKSAIEEGQREALKEFIITPGNDPSRAARLAATLMQCGIEVKQAVQGFSNAKTRDYSDDATQSREFPAGSYIVSLAQPAKRLAKTLLDRHTEQDKEFLDEQKVRNRQRQSDEFYDVTAWSLPLLYDVPCFMAEQASNVTAARLKELPKPPGKLRGGPAKLAYLIPWGTQAAAAALADLFQQNIRVHTTDKPSKLNGVDFPPGTLIVKLNDNPADLHERIAKLAETHGVDVYPTDSSWVEVGSNFGSANVKYLPKPRIALGYNTPTNPNSTGWTRYLIEQRYGYPVTTLRGEQLRQADLSKYNVLILPNSFGLGSVLSDGVKLREWVQQGGTLIAFGGSSAWLADEKVGLLPSKLEKRDKPAAAKDQAGDQSKDAKKDAAAITTTQPPAPAKDTANPVDKAIEPAEEQPSGTPGAIVRVNINRAHWLGFGYGDTTTVLVDSNRIFSLVKLDRGTNVGVYAPDDKFFVSGFMFEDARKQLPNKAFLMHVPTGRGHVIAFAEDPNYRAFLEGLNVMFFNAVFFGPGH
ncbi:MAG: peptidase M14 [Acidobacteria bacterium]|nr:peptidase M14 [Acidobacteriota bacterium]MBI3427696.1 peptidase M14 [Acidobacteriota bacterium]